MINEVSNLGLGRGVRQEILLVQFLRFENSLVHAADEKGKWLAGARISSSQQRAASRLTMQ